MKYRGRIIMTGLIWSVFLVGLLYVRRVNGELHIASITSIFVCYSIIGWLLGWQYDRMAFHSVRDMLTLTYNRRYVYQIFNKMKRQANRRGKRLTVYIIDVDDFKQVNDRYGHAVGDMVLKSISAILKGMIGEGDIISRWGGDEFIMIAFCDGQNEPILDTFSVETGIGEFHNTINSLISVSIGQSHYPNDGNTLDELLKVADDNMYGLKQEHKDIVI